MANKSCSSISSLLLFLIASGSALTVKECDHDVECESASEFSALMWHSNRTITLPYLCFDPRRNSTPEVSGDTVQANKFKPKSSWLGAYLMDLHGVALSPLFLAHGHLSCTEYVLTQVDKGRLALEMKHYSSDKVDYRFDFNQSGWVEYKKRYGCPKESLQMNNTRIIDTDYEHYVLIYGCAESQYQEGHHISGYLLLVQSPNVPEATWNKVQTFFFALFPYDEQNYTLPDRSTILQDRATECQPDTIQKKNNAVLCPKKALYNMALVQREVVREIKAVQKARLKKKEQHDPHSEEARTYAYSIQSWEQDIPVEEISCFVTMFLAVSLALYWTHFSF